MDAARPCVFFQQRSGLVDVRSPGRDDEKELVSLARQPAERAKEAIGPLPEEILAGRQQDDRPTGRALEDLRRKRSSGLTWRVALHIDHERQIRNTLAAELREPQSHRGVMCPRD